MTDLATSPDYRAFVTELKQRVRAAQLRASLSVNRALIVLYWSIGRDILARQQAQGWGSKVVQQLSKDLRRAFPEMKGFSTRNLNYMRMFAAAWPDEHFVQQAAAQIPWFHNVAILEKVKDPDARRLYIEQTQTHGWSRAVLTLQIERRLHERLGHAITNFSETLPPKTKNDLIVEYALNDVNKPIGVANWESQIVNNLPDDLKGSLPTVAQLEAELSQVDVP